jgi:DNA (cytosine-5)-methyltransferase 1
MKTTVRTASVYYNEIDPAACEWLRELMKKGMIPEGDIDERSIADVEPDDLKHYAQCHFFAGIGGWPLALQLAGAQDLECWTGSCPCQPWSTNGKRLGVEDERHLWPAFHRLIAERRPQLVIGEQVEAAIAHGWLDLVSSGLEAAGYACGAAVLGAHSVGAPHVRQRLYWGGVLGDASREGGQPPYEAAGGGGRGGHGLAERSGEAGSLANARGERPRERQGEADDQRRGEAGVLADAHGLQHGQDARGARGEVAGARGVGDPCAGDAARRGRATRRGFWEGCDWLPCRDGKARPAEPGTFPLAHGVPRRVDLLKGYGNAIVPQVAAEFVKALIG